MKYLPQRKSIRLSQYDYTQPGMYFVTINTKGGECLFGGIKNGMMELNGFGMIAEQEWLQTMMIRTNIFLDKYIIMPNHIHGIIEICDLRAIDESVRASDDSVRAWRAMPVHEMRGQSRKFAKPIAESLPTIIGAYKSSVSKYINILRQSPGQAVWHRNYYERVIRNDDELNRIQEYIKDNPKNWP